MADFDELLGRSQARSKRAKKGRAPKKLKTYLRVDPDTGEKKRVTRDDPEYDEWLTPTQWRSEERRTTTKDEGFVETFKKELGKDLGRKVGSPLRPGRRGTASAKRVGQRVGQIVKQASAGNVSVLTKVAPLAVRLAGVGIALGLAWWGIQTLHARAIRKRVEAEIAAGEARLKRPYTERELAALLPQYRKWFEAKSTEKLMSQPSTLR
jgi:hypothetical protein